MLNKNIGLKINMNTEQNQRLPEQSDTERLAIYKILLQSCTHLYSKNKLVEEKFKTAAELFAKLCKQDPTFLVHFAVWCSKQDSKDLQLLSIYFNFLSDGDGQAFFTGSKLNKPNYRQVSSALLQELSPHLVERILNLGHKRFEVPGLLNNSKHLPTAMVTAVRKYLKYREANPQLIEGIKRSGLANKFKQLYRLSHTSPSAECAGLLNWPQKDNKEIKIQKLPDFNNLSSDQIVEELTKNKLSPTVALSVLPPNKITASVAKVLLENSTGNQAIILYNWFARNGHLENTSIKDLFKDKIKQSTTAVDRIDTLTRNATAEDKQEMAQVRSEKRKSQANTGSLGKIFLSIDQSGSMQTAIEFAKDRASIIAECIEDANSNFRWGLFNTQGKVLPLPKSFTKEGFYQSLYGVRAGGGTDCLSLYADARKFGAKIDIYVTDSEDTLPDPTQRIEKYHLSHPEHSKPRLAVIIDFNPSEMKLENGLKNAGIPVVRIKPDAIKESALVAQSIRTALIGELAIIEEILNTPLPKLPVWWNSVGNQNRSDEIHRPEQEQTAVRISGSAKTSRKKRTKNKMVV